MGQRSCRNFSNYVDDVIAKGKAHHFCLKRFIKICDYTCKVQLFWTLKLFVLILTQLFENKIIWCQVSTNTPYTNSTQQGQNQETVGGLLLGAFGTFAVLVFTKC